MAYAGFLRTLPTPTATLAGFVCLLNEDWFTQANANALDGTTFINGGGSLRIYESDGGTQLPVEVVSFVTGGTPEVQVWVRVTNYTGSATTVWVESDAVATAQPVVTDTYGRNAVYSDRAMQIHCDGASSFLDSTGNNTLTDLGSPARGVSGQIGDGVSLTNSGVSSDGIGGYNLSTGYTINFWGNISNTPRYGAIIRYATSVGGSNKCLEITRSQNNNNLFITHTGVSEGDGVVITNGLDLIITGELHFYTIKWDGTNIRGYRDGALIWTSGTYTTSPNMANATLKYWFYESAAANIDLSLLDELVLANTYHSDAYTDSEYLNQDGPSTFGTSSGWTTGGGGETLAIDSGNYELSGTDLNLTAEYSIIAESGSYTLQGSPVTFIDPSFSGQTIGVVKCEYVSNGINIEYVSDGINTEYVSDGINVSYANDGLNVEYNSN